MDISNEAIAPEFPDFRLDERYAIRAVEETLGDISVLEVDETANPVSDALFFNDDDDEEELGDGADVERDSDSVQALTEMPEGCA